MSFPYNNTSSAKKRRFTDMFNDYVKNRPQSDEPFRTGEWLSTLDNEHFAQLVYAMTQALEDMSCHVHIAADVADLYAAAVIAEGNKGSRKKSFKSGIKSLETLIAIETLLRQELVEMKSYMALHGDDDYEITVTQEGLAVGRHFMSRL